MVGNDIVGTLIIFARVQQSDSWCYLNVMFYVFKYIKIRYLQPIAVFQVHVRLVSGVITPDIVSL